MARGRHRGGLKKRAWREAKKVARRVAKEGARQIGDFSNASAEIMTDVVLGTFTLGLLQPTNGRRHRR